MRKIVIGIFVASFILVSSGAGAFADDPIKKLGRGCANLITAPLELGKSIGDVNTESGFMAGATYGVLQGLWKTGIRYVVAVYEIVSFPIPIPKEYGPILTDPEFFLEEK